MDPDGGGRPLAHRTMFRYPETGEGTGTHLHGSPGRERMKIALVRYRYSPHGGAERYLDMLAAGLQASGAQVRLLSSSWKGGGAARFPWEELSVPHRPVSVRLWRFARAVRSWAGTHPDWLLFSLERIPGAEVYRAGDGCHAEWLIRKRVLRPLSWRFDFLRPLNRSYLSLERGMFRSPSLRAVVANSERGKEEIARHYGVPRARITVVYNGVDLSRFPEGRKAEARRILRDRYALPAGVPVFLHVGSGFARKGVGALVRAAARLAGKGCSFRVIVAGKGDPGPYREMAGEARDRVLFTGPIREPEDHFLGADAFVFPTVYEPFSNACLEAMAAGIPVVTTRVNGVSELLRDGESGFLLEDPMDDAALAGRMEALFSEETRSRLGREARKAAESLPAERNTRETLQVLARVWKERAAGEGPERA
ncbi:MAG: glycosyltransferase family 4 protein [Deltaproteobacteria bacterium]|nr:glycosyltransferase family 4 protein [Deltaproteobacteria bacterium]